MGKLGRDWSRGVEVTVPVTGGGGNNQACLWVTTTAPYGQEHGLRVSDHFAPTHLCPPLVQARHDGRPAVPGQRGAHAPRRQCAAPRPRWVRRHPQRHRDHDGAQGDQEQRVRRGGARR
jgi:hypothetical protein